MIDLKEFKTYNKVKQDKQYIFVEETLDVSCRQYMAPKEDGEILINTVKGLVNLDADDIPPVTKETLENNGIDLKIPDISLESNSVFDKNGIELFDRFGIQLRILS